MLPAAKQKEDGKTLRYSSYAFKTKNNIFNKIGRRNS